MSDEPEQTVAGITKRKVRAMAAMTVLAVAIVVVALVTVEPNPIMWGFAALMLLSAAAFWILYFLARRRL